MAMVNRSDQLLPPHCTFPQLPLEIIANIFSRLPIQDLFQYRLVSKDWHQNWKQLISDPSLMELHHSRGEKHHAQFLVLCFSRGGWDSKLYSANDIGDNISMKLQRIPLNTPVREIEIVGSSNGLVCLALLPDYDFFYVCNPATREYLRLLRAPALNAGGRKYVDNIRCGFAFDATTDTYNVIYTMYVPGEKDKTEIQIYTVGTWARTWRKLESQYCYSAAFESTHKPLVLLNGALHWLTRKVSDIFRTVVGVIDVAGESFKDFETPPELTTPSGYSHPVRTLSVLDDCLCICASLRYDMTKIWLLTDYEDPKSWTLKYSFRKMNMWPSSASLDYVKIIGRKAKDNCVIFSCGKNQGYYDFEKDEYREIVVEDVPPDTNRIDAILHTGSLISPVSAASRFMKDKMCKDWAYFK